MNAREAQILAMLKELRMCLQSQCRQTSGVSPGVLALLDKSYAFIEKLDRKYKEDARMK